ncbi:MAG: ATP/GTP-binding protein [Nitratireductor sp.]|nr:ATP/GTP-binding protein [Nitratireductor sp.]
MIESFEISNYRSFKDVKVRDCRTVNLVVGDNGSGKTALLEALFLVAGVSPELISKTRVWRGYEGSRFAGTRDDIIQSVFGDLFYNFDLKLKPKINLRGDQKGETRRLEIAYVPTGTKRIRPPSRDGKIRQVAAENIVDRLRFDYNISNHGDFTVVPEFNEEQIVFNSPSDAVVSASFHASMRNPSTGEMASRFSKLSVNFEARRFIETFCSHFPQVRDISLELWGGNPMLYAEVDGIKDRIPLSNISGGMNKFASILLSIAHQRNGVVIIDEIENGFYYERMKDIWKTIINFSNEYNVQLFVSTHSSECISAFRSAIYDSQVKDIKLLRTVMKNNETIVRAIEGGSFINSIDHNIEIR